MVYFILIGLSLFYLRNIMSNNNKRKAPKIVEEDEFSESSDDLEIDERSNELVETESDENVDEEESLTPIKKNKKAINLLRNMGVLLQTRKNFQLKQLFVEPNNKLVLIRKKIRMFHV